MAKPQLEDGYTKIANEILEVLSSCKLNGTQFRIVLTVVRYTYGFNRKSHEFSLTFLLDSLAMEKSQLKQVKRELDSLINSKVLIEISKPTKNSSRIIEFNKDYSQWANTTSGLIRPVDGLDQRSKKTSDSGLIRPVGVDGLDQSTSGLIRPVRNKLLNKTIKEKVNKNIGDLFFQMIAVYTSDNELVQAINHFIEHRKSMKKPIKNTHTLGLILKELDKHPDKIAVINQSIMNGWKGLFELKKSTKSNKESESNIFTQIGRDEGLW